MKNSLIYYLLIFYYSFFSNYFILNTNLLAKILSKLIRIDLEDIANVRAIQFLFRSCTLFLYQAHCSHCLAFVDLPGENLINRSNG